MSELRTSWIFKLLDQASGPGRKLSAVIGGLSKEMTRVEKATARANTLLGLQKQKVDALAKANERLERAQRRYHERSTAAASTVYIGNQLRQGGRAALSPLLFGLGQAGQFEDFRISLEVLLGSAETADRRLQALAIFGAKTPFDLPEVVRASTVLETLTRGELAAGDGLRMVGDVAAGTKQPISELAVWFGRLYDGVMSGRPVGEAMMRMQELGIVTGDTRGKVEEMLASGEKGARVWAVLTGEFSRFSGMMERKSTALSGKLSNLGDAWQLLGASFGKLFLPLAKRSIDALTWLITRTQEFVEKHPYLAKALGLGAAGMGILAIVTGTAIVAMGSLIGLHATLGYGLDVLGVKLNLASLRMTRFAVASRLAGGGVKGAGLALLTGLRGTATRILPWLTGLLSAGGIASLSGLLGSIGSTLAAIPGIGWIALGVVGVAATIYKFWRPLKTFFGGFWDGFMESTQWLQPMIGDLKQGFIDLFRVTWVPLRALWTTVANIIAPSAEAGEQLRLVGVFAGKTFGMLTKFLLWPIRLIAWLARQVSALVDLIMGKLEPALAILGQAASWLGGNVRPAAAAALAAPALAAGGDYIPAPRSYGEIRFEQPITIHAAPGMDEASLARMVRREIDDANRENVRRLGARRRGALHDG